MNPAKITIEGNYWDCQIYRGRLYLFTMDGSIKVINWYDIVDSFLNNEYLNIAISYAFKSGRELYSFQALELLSDNEIKSVLQNKFELLSNQQYVLTQDEIAKFTISTQDSPFKELHTDSEVFSNRLFALTHNSLLSAEIHKKSKKYSIQRTAWKHFDLYAFGMKANRYAKMAISAGDDGLMEYNAAFNSPHTHLDPWDDRRMKIVSERHSSFADYSLLSIYNSSFSGDSFLAYQTWKPESQYKELVKEGDINELQIFHSAGPNEGYLSWGSNEKIYRAIEGGFQIVRFNNYAKNGEPLFSVPKLIPLQQWKGRIISAATAYFGTILHCEHAVVVMLSDGTFYNIPGEISRFRIYPRSINYENHLHIIQDDKIEIYSFNNDYFIDQQSKDFGVAFKIPKPYYSFGRYSIKEEADEKYYSFLNGDTDTDESTTDKDVPF